MKLLPNHHIGLTIYSHLFSISCICDAIILLYLQRTLATKTVPLELASKWK